MEILLKQVLFICFDLFFQFLLVFINSCLSMFIPDFTSVYLSFLFVSITFPLSFPICLSLFFPIYLFVSVGFSVYYFICLFLSLPPSSLFLTGCLPITFCFLPLSFPVSSSLFLLLSVYITSLFFRNSG